MTAEPTFIVWLDPGLVTGMACYDLEEENFLSWQYELVDLRRRFEVLIPAFGHRMAVGWEMFLNVGGPRSSTPGPSNQAIGLVRTLVEESGTNVSLLKPQPSSARALGQTVFLKRLGWHKPNQGHANDAAQHLLAYLLKQRPMPSSIRAKLFPGYEGRGTVAP